MVFSLLMLPAIGTLFPTGGPVPPELIIGRGGEIEDIRLRIKEGVHLLLTGPRRIGKTTVCRAACTGAANDGALVIHVEVPERVDSRDLLQLIVDRCAGLSLRDEGREATRALRPLIETLLGVPLDLSELGAEPAAATARAVMGLPRALADETGAQTVLFLDELQRVTDYADGDAILSDLVDLYGGQSAVSVIADGSNERSVDRLMGDPGHIGKLCEIYPLNATISRETWRAPLKQRFEAAELSVTAEGLELLLDFGDERPYPTMLACRHTALTARRLDPDGPADVGPFEVQTGIDAARAQLDADDA